VHLNSLCQQKADFLGWASLHNAIVGDQSDLVIGPEVVRCRSTDYDHRGGGVSRNVLTDRSKDHPDESSMPAGTND
jgi:hypothetical protein